MPFLIALGVIATIVFYLRRAQDAVDVANGLADAVCDAGSAARRFDFRRRANVHPVEPSEDPRVALAALAAAHVERDGLPTKDKLDRLTVQTAIHLKVPSDAAQELAVHGRWLVAQCGTPDAAIRRIARKLDRMSGPEAKALAAAIVQKTLD